MTLGTGAHPEDGSLSTDAYRPRPTGPTGTFAGFSLIEPAGGEVVAEFFDIGLSRSLPWEAPTQSAAPAQHDQEPGT
ncbi:hypothetical protein ACQP2Y_13470 [Actinoplanes sp. CA-051413]|uniref:hypothetical protein n=1 Tax=Actinoplanes sp. CA-051413 TaxID=3239899 RepID=UPI003D98FBD4